MLVELGLISHYYKIRFIISRAPTGTELGNKECLWMLIEFLSIWQEINLMVNFKPHRFRDEKTEIHTVEPHQHEMSRCRLFADKFALHAGQKLGWRLCLPELNCNDFITHDWLNTSRVQLTSASCSLSANRACRWSQVESVIRLPFRSILGDRGQIQMKGRWLKVTESFFFF